MRTDLDLINEALDQLDPALAFLWREIKGHAHDGSGPATDGMSFRALASQHRLGPDVVRRRFARADRAVCAHFARYYRDLLKIPDTLGDHAIAPYNAYNAQRRDVVA
jgi:hypothetical protein